MLKLTFWSAVTVVGVLASEPLRADDFVAIPRLEKITIDGQADDWGGEGFRVDVMADKKGLLSPADDFDAKLRLAWNEKGLLALVTVTDDSPSEVPDLVPFPQGDSVELFVGDKWGTDNRYNTIISPGLDPKFPKLRYRFDAWAGAKERLDELKADVVCRKTDRGYVVEALLPWENLRVTARDGGESAFRINVTDADHGKVRRLITWMPSGWMIPAATSWHKIRLAKTAADPVTFLATGNYVKTRYAWAALIGDAALAGKSVRLEADGNPVATTQMDVQDGHAAARFRVPFPRPGVNWNRLGLVVEGQPPFTLDLISTDRVRGRALIDQEMIADRPCFWGEKLPELDFERPELVEQLIGPYTLKTTYYDASFNPVTQAETVGRYGAIVEVTPENGRPFKRFRTLCRVEGNSRRWPNGEAKGRIDELPPMMQLNSTLLEREGDTATEWVSRMLSDRLWNDPPSAAMLAHLYEIRGTQEKIDFWNNAWQADRQWWVTLKRKLNGADRANRPFACPVALNGPAQTVVREGTLAEAGMTPDAADKIDAVCTAWSADSDEAFAVCIVRNGVIVLHKAYGTRDGKPMTVETQSWMASLTKLMGGALLMMMVDRGQLGLDDRIDQHLAEFRDIPVKTPLTVRHCYTHTSGLWGHGWDYRPDLEEILAAYYPYLHVGRRYEYNAGGMALGGKIMELYSGQSLPTFYRKHLLEPLGCSRTFVDDTGGSAESTPLDMVKIGQMLLNGGAYGRWRFFSEDTFKQMLPPTQEVEVPGGVKITGGIGCGWYAGEGLGPRTFGHGAASSAILRVDLDHKLVVVMCRNAAGKNHAIYSKRFFKTISESLPPAVATPPK